MHLARPQRDARIYALFKCTMGRIDWCRELQQMTKRITIIIIIVRNRRNSLESGLLRRFLSFSHAPYGHMHKVKTEGPILSYHVPSIFEARTSQGHASPAFTSSLPRPLLTSTTRSANRQVRHAQHNTIIESAADPLLSPACQHAILRKHCFPLDGLH